MINLYKSHSKNPVVNLVSKNILLRTLLLVGILFYNQAYSITNTSTFKKVDAATLTVTLNKTDNPCQGRSVGTITTSFSGGVAPYTFLWNDAVATQNRSNLPGGTYSVTVTDFLGDTGTSSITLVDPQPIVIQGTGFSQIKCNADKGSVFISVTGGTPPYTYSWKKNGIIVSINQDLIDKVAGVYSIAVTDNGIGSCSANTNFTLVEPSSIGVTESTHTNNVEFGESNGVIKLNVIGGKPAIAPAEPYTYLWNDGITTKDRSGLASGNYSVTVTDENNCTKVISSIILPISKFDVTGTFQNNKCAGTPNGSIDITTSGGISQYKFKWSDQSSFVANPDRTGLKANTYTLTAQDNNGTGAIRTLPFTITEPSPLTLTATSTNNVCFADNNGRIDLAASGGIGPYSYILNAGTPVSFSGNTLTITNLTSGTHTITIMDANSCLVTPAMSLNILPLKALAYQKPPLITQVTCTDDKSGAINVFIEGGQTPYQYKWSNDANLNSADNPNLQEGNYTLQVTDALGCSFNPPAIAVTRQAQAVSLTKDAQTNNVCFNDKNGSVTFTLSGGTLPYTPSWTYEGKPFALTNINPSTTKITVKNLASGKYTLMVSDQKGCISTTLTIDITPFKLLTNPIIKNISCGGINDATIEVKPSGGVPGYNYFWTSVQFPAPMTTPKIGPLSPGNYNLKITDGSNCILDTTFKISNAIPITAIESIYEKANVCIADSANGSARIKVKGGVPPYTSFQFSVIDPSTGLPVALAPTVIDPNFPDVAINNTLFPGTYFLTVSDQNLCPSVLPKFVIERNNCDPGNDKIIVDPLMSPNGDGLGNEFFYINKIEDYPENEVIVYNRWGMEVFTIRGYDNKDRVFRGIANSALTNRNEVLVDGVYYYTIRSVMDKKQKVNKGYVIIKR